MQDAQKRATYPLPIKSNDQQYNEYIDHILLSAVPVNLYHSKKNTKSKIVHKKTTYVSG